MPPNRIKTNNAMSSCPETFRLIAAPFTPMKRNGAVCFESIEKQAESLFTNGVRSAFICGTTGEGISLTVTERREIAERWIRSTQIATIVHVGHSCIEDCKNLASHANDIGASAIAAMAPSFFKPSSVADLVAYCASIACAAPDLPFYFYHMPDMTGVKFPMRSFLEAAADRIPNLAGIKFTHEDFLDFGRCMDFEAGRFEMLWGRDEVLLSALAIGARGAVGSTYNYLAPLYRSLIEAYFDNDMQKAQQLQQKVREFIPILLRYGGLPAGKAIMKLGGIDLGPTRMPLNSLSEIQVKTLAEELQGIGLIVK